MSALGTFCVVLSAAADDCLIPWLGSARCIPSTAEIVAHKHEQRQRYRSNCMSQSHFELHSCDELQAHPQYSIAHLTSNRNDPACEFGWLGLAPTVAQATENGTQASTWPVRHRQAPGHGSGAGQGEQAPGTKSRACPSAHLSLAPPRASSKTPACTWTTSTPPPLRDLARPFPIPIHGAATSGSTASQSIASLSDGQTSDR